MEVDLEQAKRALAVVAEALSQCRGVIRQDRSGMLRIRTEEKTSELWAAAGLVAFAVASVLASWPTGRAREEEPLGIG
ncbi:MAG: hypothetical protein QN170_00330 [Armatimonadota bacterium]|nr:hypothetical protein [Armatimonadota bacterium]